MRFIGRFNERGKLAKKTKKRLIAQKMLETISKECVLKSSASNTTKLSLKAVVIMLATIPLINASIKNRHFLGVIRQMLIHKSTKAAL